MNKGESPMARYDGKPFSKDEHGYATQGNKLSYRMVLVQIKGDWAEYAHTLGLRSWKTKEWPCPFCFAAAPVSAPAPPPSLAAFASAATTPAASRDTPA